MRDLRLAQARSVVFERQLVLRFVDAKAAQSISVRELAELAQLFFRERGLQVISNFHECHEGIIAARGGRNGRQVCGHLTQDRGEGYI